jgi:hypothetical protein
VIIEGGLIVGYLTAAFLRGGERMADRAVDALLHRLTDLVADRMGFELIDRLQEHPRDETVQREVGLMIDGATIADATFARELAALVAELDGHGGRQMINEVYAQTNVQAFDRSMAIGRDFNYFSAPDRTDKSEGIELEWTDFPSWVQFCTALSVVLIFVGMLGFFMFSSVLAWKVGAFGMVMVAAVPFAYGAYSAYSLKKGR